MKRKYEKYGRNTKKMKKMKKMKKIQNNEIEKEIEKEEERLKFKKRLLDVIETTMLDVDNQIENLESYSTIKALVLIMEAMVWRSSDDWDDLTELGIGMDYAKEIVREKYPELIKRYELYFEHGGLS